MQGVELIWCALVLLASYEAGSIACAPLAASDTDLLSLLDFKRAITNDPTDALGSWNASVPFCRWNGVRCGRAFPQRVVALDLAEQVLAGRISPSLGNLTRLASIKLSTNRFSGEIPPLGHLRELDFHDLSYNLQTELFRRRSQTVPS